MPAYVIADVEITDPPVFQEYRKLAMPTIAQYGGTAIVVTPQSETLEGHWHPKELVILEFDSIEQAKRWYDAPEYREPKAMRERSANSNVVLAQGL